MIHIQLCAEGLNQPQREYLDQVVRTVNGLQTSFRIRSDVKKIELPGKGLLKADPSVEYLAKKLPANGDRIICVTSRAFREEMITHEDRRVFVVSIAEWEEEYAPPALDAFLMYQVAGALVSFAGDLTYEQNDELMHGGITGCVMDYCACDQIKFGMFAGFLCGACRQNLLQLNATQEQLDAIGRLLNYARLASIGKRPRINWNSAFVVMRFSENDENQSAYEKGIKPGLQDAGLVVERGDDRVESRQILDKVNDAIGRARFIVAKIDVENLNVYYELGIAMGADKDVLLISEHKVDLPTDLKNWNCLTYRMGDYEGLRIAVSRFFKDNFYL